MIGQGVDPCGYSELDAILLGHWPFFDYILK
jgi:hypothetical protein